MAQMPVCGMTGWPLRFTGLADSVPWQPMVLLFAPDSEVWVGRLSLEKHHVKPTGAGWTLTLGRQCSPVLT